MSSELYARNMDIKSDSEELRKKKKEESWRENFHFVRKYIDNHKQNTGKNMDVKGHFEVSDGNEEHVIRNQRKGNPCYKAAKNLAECVCVLLFCRRYNFQVRKLDI